MRRVKTPSWEWSVLLRRAALMLLVGLVPEVQAAPAPAPTKAQDPKRKQRPAHAKQPAPAAPVEAEAVADEQDMFALDAQLEQQTQVARRSACSP